MQWLVALLAVLALASASDVLDLTTGNFDSTLKDLDLALVEFFAPWCGHCKSLAPEYEKAATELKSNDPPVTLAKVDATVESELAQKFGVSGYPTLKLFRKGVESGPYEGPRTASGIVKYMQKQAGPSSKELTSVEAAKKFLETSEHVVVGAFDNKNVPLAAAFQQFADNARDDYRIGHTYDAEVASFLDIGKNAVAYIQPKKLHSKFEEPRAIYTGKPKWQSIKEYVADKAVGLVGHLTPDNEKDFPKPVLVTFYDVDFTRDPSGAKYVRNRLLKLAQDTADLQFAVANTADFGQYQNALGIKVGEINVAILSDKGKFKLTEKLSKFEPEVVKKFIADYKAGNLEEYIKSEPVPANNDGPVKVVVGKNFKDIVEDPSKDVLIEFYAPWCGHCKQLAPKWDELGAKFEGDSGITIAKMDATANDPPAGFQVQGYPTLYFVPANAKSSPKKYEGAREVKDFVDYIKKNRTTKADKKKSDDL